MFLVCVWYVHNFPKGKWRKDMKMCLKVRLFHFPNMFVLEIGRQEVDDVNPIKSCDLQGPGLLYSQDPASLTGLLWGPNEIMTGKRNTSKKRIQVTFSVMFTVLIRWCSGWARRRWGRVSLGLNLSSGSSGSVTRCPVAQTLWLSFLCL